MIEIRACTPDDAAAVTTLLSELGYTVPIRQATENIQEFGKTGAALQQLGRERDAHLSRQVGLCMSPYCIARDAEALGHGPLRKPGGDSRSICGRAR